MQLMSENLLRIVEMATTRALSWHVGRSIRQSIVDIF